MMTGTKMLIRQQMTSQIQRQVYIVNPTMKTCAKESPQVHPTFQERVHDPTRLAIVVVFSMLVSRPIWQDPPLHRFASPAWLVQTTQHTHDSYMSISSVEKFR